MKQFSILVVDDDERLLAYLEHSLQLAGFNVVTAPDGTRALETVQRKEVDLVILDMMMPGMDGAQTLAEMRAFSSVPVIFLSVKAESDDIINGLQLGADDYMAKPFNPEELMARIEAVKRRMRPPESRIKLTCFNSSGISIDFSNSRVTVDDRAVELTRIEWMLLSELVRHNGECVAYEDLLTHVWGPQYRDEKALLRTWMSRLRRKLGSDGDHPGIIETRPKLGYIVRNY
jgi:two-component system KDP operon response regulator KdpE